MSEERTDQLFAGIIKSAHDEAATILEQAQRDAKAVSDSYAKRVADVVALEKQAAKKRLEQIKRMEESTIKNLQRKYHVSQSERLRHQVLERTVELMAALIPTKPYRKIQIGWIAEAAIGLDRSEAKVACSFKEKLDDSMLREAEAIIKRATGKDIALQLSEQALTGQGIEVSSLNGKVAYNNQVTTRMIRHDRDLKELMEGQPCRKE